MYNFVKEDDNVDNNFKAETCSLRNICLCASCSNQTCSNKSCIECQQNGIAFVPNRECPKYEK